MSNSILDTGTKYIVTKSVNNQTKTHHYGTAGDGRTFDTTNIVDNITTSTYYESVDLTTETTFNYIDPYSLIVDPRISTNIPADSETE